MKAGEACTWKSSELWMLSQQRAKGVRASMYLAAGSVANPDGLEGSASPAFLFQAALAGDGTQ
jgi:hypothetical protein